LVALPGYCQTFLTTETNLADPPFGMSQVHRFDDESESFASTADAASAFQGVTLLDGVVLVADLAEGRIQRFTLEGALLTPFADFDVPTFLESDGAGNVYTTQFSLGPAVATRFDFSGSVVGTFTSPSANGFAGIDADALGNVFIATTSNSLEKFAPDGTFLASIPVSATPLDIAIDEDRQRLFLADESSSSEGIRVYDLSTSMPIFLHTISTPANSSINGLHYAAGVDAIFAVDSGLLSNDPRGMQLTMDGSVTATYRPLGIDVALDIVHRVPEPATWALIVVGVIALVSCWNLRRCNATGGLSLNANDSVRSLGEGRR